MAHAPDEAAATRGRYLHQEETAREGEFGGFARLSPVVWLH